MAVKIYDKGFDFDGTQIITMVCEKGCKYISYQTFKTPQDLFDFAYYGCVCNECEIGQAYPEKIMDSDDKWATFSVVTVHEPAQTRFDSLD